MRYAVYNGVLHEIKEITMANSLKKTVGFRIGWVDYEIPSALLSDSPEEAYERAQSI